MPNPPADLHRELVSLSQSIEIVLMEGVTCEQSYRRHFVEDVSGVSNLGKKIRFLCVCGGEGGVSRA